MHRGGGGSGEKMKNSKVIRTLKELLRFVLIEIHGFYGQIDSFCQTFLSIENQLLEWSQSADLGYDPNKECVPLSQKHPKAPPNLRRNCFYHRDGRIWSVS